MPLKSVMRMGKKSKSLLKDGSDSKMTTQMKSKRSQKSRADAGADANAPAPVEQVPEKPKNHVYVYMQLQQIDSLPKYCDGPDREFIIELSHQSGTIQKLKEPFDDSDIKLKLNEKCRCSIGDYKLTFTVRIEQDSFDEMNVYSDCPVVVTIYQLTPSYIKDFLDEDALPYELGEMEYEPEWENERIEPIAMGFIDLFTFFSQKRALSTVTHFVYPLRDHRLQAFKMTWEIYTLLPLLKENTFENIMFLELESIYNAHRDLADDCEDLMVDLSLRSTKANDDGTFDTQKICSYSTFSKELILEQDDNYIWASMKEYEPVPGIRLCEQTGLSFNKYQLFKDALGTEFVDFGVDFIDPKEDHALVCNALHRFVLNRKLAKLLEEAFACGTQELLLEVYRFSLPEVKLLAGTANLAYLAYPGVNKVQLLVLLSPVEIEIETKSNNQEKGKNKDKDKGKGKEVDVDVAKKGVKKAKSKASTVASKRMSAGKSAEVSSAQSTRTSLMTATEEGEEEEERPIFASLTICLLYPLGEGNEKLVKYNENEACKDILKSCRSLEKDPSIDPRNCEVCYRLFDHVVMGIINDILKNKILDIEKCAVFFCCHLANMTNRITKLVACDFNKQCPTKTSVQFTNLLTTVYKELECRMLCVLNNCSKRNLEDCVIQLDVEVAKQIKYFNMFKYASESDEHAFGEFLLKTLKHECIHCYIINFYHFLYDAEKQDFNVAKQYLKLPLADKDVYSTYYADIVELYMEYKNIDSHEGDEEGAAMTYDILLERLTKLAERYAKDIDLWILLYCYYSRSNYLPGMEYTRWKFENLYFEPQRKLACLPISLWDMHYQIDDDRDFQNSRNEYFYKTFKTFLSLGTYTFAQVIYHHISGEFNDFELYCIDNTFSVLMQQDLGDYEPKQFTHEGELADLLKATELHTNGNTKYHMNQIDEAMNFYGQILDIDIEDYDPFTMGIMRFAYYHLRNGNPHAASLAFDKLIDNEAVRLFVLIGKAKAMYWLGNLNGSLDWFAESTKFKIYMPDVWAWLALINLRLGETFKALECWKRARLYSTTAIDEAILDELDKIGLMDVSLYIDYPIRDLSQRVESLVQEVESKSDILARGFSKKYC